MKLTAVCQLIECPRMSRELPQSCAGGVRTVPSQWYSVKEQLGHLLGTPAPVPAMIFRLLLSLQLSHGNHHAHDDGGDGVYVAGAAEIAGAYYTLLCHRHRNLLNAAPKQPWALLSSKYLSPFVAYLYCHGVSLLDYSGCHEAQNGEWISCGIVTAAKI